ncbi:hypothetical protein EDC94DRAFT_586078 [Helicostylum pulchrum]|nr:hypothetical protein EDC94DRAFT_586078 [Helicostylum pulchrum]
MSFKKDRNVGVNYTEICQAKPYEPNRAVDLDLIVGAFTKLRSNIVKTDYGLPKFCFLEHSFYSCTSNKETFEQVVSNPCANYCIPNQELQGPSQPLRGWLSSLLTKDKNGGLEEFAQEYSNTSDPTSHQSPEASKTPDLPDATTHHSPPMKKSCMLNKNKKFVIFNTAAYLTSPNKPKIQCVDIEQTRDWCEKGLEAYGITPFY